jgi:hypothetical protein
MAEKPVNEAYLKARLIEWYSFCSKRMRFRQATPKKNIVILQNPNFSWFPSY